MTDAGPNEGCSPHDEEEGSRSCFAPFRLDDVPVGMAVVTEDRITTCNGGFASLLGRAPDEVKGRRFSGLWGAPVAGHEILKRMDSTQLGGRELLLEASWRREDGGEIWVELRCRRTESASGGADSWLVVATDASRHHRAQEFLNLQRNLVECAQDGISILDVGNPERPHYVFVNPAWERLTGYRAEEVIGGTPEILIRPAGPRDGFDRIWEAIGRGESTTETICLCRRDGTLFWSETSIFPLSGSTGVLRQFVAVSRDVTRRIETRLKLAESERRFRRFFTDNRLPMFLLESSGRGIIEANIAAAAFYGYGREELAEMTLDDLRGEAGEPVSGPDGGCDLRHRTRAGMMRDVMAYMGDLELDDGTVRYMIVVDVTAQRRAESRLRVAMEEAEAASVAKSEFLQVVGHEIRTPMNAIVGFAELLQSAESDEEREESAEMILNGTRSLESVLDALLDYISWNSPRAAGEESEMSLAEFARATIDRFSEAALAKGLELDLRLLTEGSSPCWLPVSDYQKIVGFLIDNAIKFSEHGKISIDLSRPRPGVLHISVGDSGIGIEPDLLPRLFHPFGSGDSGTRRLHEGIGLGLAHCHRMTSFYGGRVEVQSQPGDGATFTLELPCRERPLA